MPTASIGRDVHYVSYGTPGGEYEKCCRAAKITEVDSHDPGRAGLCVFNPEGFFVKSLASGGSHLHDGSPAGPGMAPGYPGGTWHWPGTADEPCHPIRIQHPPERVDE